MHNKVYYRGFPNNLKIARRKTNNELIIIESQKTLKELTENKTQQNPYLAKILQNSITIGNER